MLPTKPRSGLSDTSNNKTVQTPSNVNKISRARSTKSDPSTPFPLQKSRSTPRSVESKPTVERRSTKISNASPDKQNRAPKASEVQVQEDLRKLKEQLALVEHEKNCVLEEFKDAKKLADEANEKLKEALAAQKRAEETSDIERFRADELDQSHIEAARKREEEWGREIENIKKRHSLDAEALLSVTQEVEKLRSELEVTTDAKNASLSEAEEAKRIARINTEKVEHLSGEVSRLKSLLDSKLHGVECDTVNVINKLNSKIDLLKYELEIAKESEEKLFIMESLVEKLSTEADNSKSAELDSLKLVDEWKKKAELLEIQLTEAKQSEESSMESLASVRKQLEEICASMQDSNFETAALREKIELLEDQLAKASQAERSSSESQISLAKELKETNASLQGAESEIAVLKGKVELLEIKVAEVRKEGLDFGKLADEWKKKAESFEAQLAEADQVNLSSSDSLASSAKQLDESLSSLEEALAENAALRMKIELLNIEVARFKEALDAAHEEAVGMGKAAESLRSQVQILEGRLQELNSEKVEAFDVESFSVERNKLHEELEMAREEEEKAKKAMEGLASALHELSVEARETQERLFTKRVEQEDAQAQIEQLRSALRNTQENYEIMLDEARYEIVCLKKALENFESESKESQNESDAKHLSCVSATNSVALVKEDGEEICANEAVEEAMYETLRLKERFSDKESELQSLSHENEELRTREAAFINKVNELSAALAENTTNKHEENGELSNSEKDYDLLPSSNEIPVGSINGSNEGSTNSEEEPKPKEMNGTGNEYLGEEEPVEVEVKMWEGYKAIEKASLDDTNESESVDDELELKISKGSFDLTNRLQSESTEDGAVSPTKQQQHQKKKTPFIRKFGNLLKKKSTNN